MQNLVLWTAIWGNKKNWFPAGPFHGWNDVINVYYAGDSLTEVHIVDPIEVVSVTSGVSLLSMEEIKKILKKEIEEHMEPEQYKEYTPGKGISLDRLELIYFRIKNTQEDGYYSYVPVWKLSCGGVNLFVMVNAIDGSIIDITEDLYINEDMTG